MGISTFAIRHLKAEYKKSMIFGLTITLSIGIMLMFFNLHSIFETRTIAEFDLGSKTTISDIVTYNPFLIYLLLMILINILCIFYANSFYLLHKKKQLGILMVSGGNVITLMKFTFVQLGITLLIALPAGFILGYILTPLLLFTVNLLAGLNLPVFIFNLTALGYTITICLILVFFLVFVSAGMVYRSEIVDLMKDGDHRKNQHEKIIFMPGKEMFALGFMTPEEKMKMIQNMKENNQMKPAVKKTDRNKGKIKLISALVFLVLSFVSFKYSFIAFFCMTFFVVLMGSFLSNNLETFIIDYQKKTLNNRYRLISLSDARDAFQSCSMLYKILYFVIVGLCSMLMMTYHDKVNAVLCLCCFCISIVLLGGCMVFKQCIESVTRKENFQFMNYVGYTQKELKKIITNEIVVFYTVMSFVPLVSMLSLMLIYNGFTFNGMYVFVIIYYLIMMCMLILTTRYLYFENALKN